MADRHAGIWLVTFLILGMFVAVVSICPSTMPEVSGGNDGAFRVRTDYGAPYPAVPVDPTDLKEGEGITIELTSGPMQEYLLEGGHWVWAFALEGGAGPHDAILQYSGRDGGGEVSWIHISKLDTIAGFGPSFSQGPGSAMIPAKVKVTLTIHKPGQYALRAWIMDQRAMDGGVPMPGSPTSVSPDFGIGIRIVEHVQPYIHMSQTHRDPVGVRMVGQPISLKLIDYADRGDSGWTGTVVDRIAIEMDGIDTSDVSVILYRSGSDIPLELRDGRLEGSLKVTEPFRGGGDSDRWELDIELVFERAGTYEITTWVENGLDGSSLTKMSSASIRVEDAGAPRGPVDDGPDHNALYDPLPVEPSARDREASGPAARRPILSPFR